MSEPTFDPGVQLKAILEGRVPAASLDPAPNPDPAPAPVTEPVVTGTPAPAPAPAPAVLPPAGSEILGVPEDVRPTSTPAPADEPHPDDPPELADNPKARSAWTVLKQGLKAAEAKARQYDNEKKLLAQQLEQAKAQKPPDMTELAALKDQVQEYENKLSQVALEQSRAFKDRYDNQIAQKQSWAAAVLMKLNKPEAEAKLLAERLANPENTAEDIQSMLGSELPVVQATLSQYAWDTMAIKQQREQALKDWKATQATLSDQDQRYSVAERSKAVVDGTSQALSQLVQEQSWAFMESAANPAWNQQRETLIQQARYALRENKPNEIVKLVMEGVSAKVYRQMAERADAKARELQAELNKIVGLRPGVGGNGSALPLNTPPADPKKPVNADEWLRKNVTGR